MLLEIVGYVTAARGTANPLIKHDRKRLNIPHHIKVYYTLIHKDQYSLWLKFL
jgi:hypothetical protein